jgi:hypothetical protein
MIRHLVPSPAAEITGLDIVSHIQSLPTPPEIHPPPLASSPSLDENVLIPELHGAFVSANPIYKQHINKMIFIVIVYTGLALQCLYNNKRQV